MELDDDKLDELLERYDQTAPKLQRQIVGGMTLRAFLAERRLKIAEAALAEYGDRRNWSDVNDPKYHDVWVPTDDGWEPAEKARKDMEAVTS